jgi:transmembrane sensor
MAKKYDKKYLERIAKKVTDGTATEAERLFLDEYYAAFEKEADVSDSLSAAEKREIGEEIKASLMQTIETAAIVPVRRIRYLKNIGIAASICIPLLIGGYLVLRKRPVLQVARTHDIAPGTNKAILVLSNGKKIAITDATKGTIAQQGSTIITKGANGQLMYNSSKGTTEISYNTLITPRGGQSYAKLPDGTEVWLNAASSLRFPTAFNGKDRVVELAGEADFKVAHNSKQPFFVKTAKQITKDIGTEFDINAYLDEPSLKTTLLEGAVEVSANGKATYLKPGQQSVNVNNTLTIQAADIDEAMAWKNGQFVFNDETLESVMRKVSRWYDVDIQYQDGNLRNVAFGGSISRFSNVSKVLHMLELTGLAKFKIEQHKIIVYK